MATNLLNYLQSLGRMIIAGFYTNFVSRNVITIGQPIDENFSDVNKKVGFRVTPTYSAQRWTKGDSLTTTAITPQVVEMTLNTVLRVGLSISNLDRNNFNPNVIQPDIEQAINALTKEADLMVIEKLRLAKNYSSFSGTPVITDVLGFIKEMNTRGIPMDRSAMLDPASKVSLFSISEIHKANERGIINPMNSGEVGQALGVTWFESNNCRMKQTPADAALAVNNKGDAYAAGATSIAFDTGSSSDLAAGDMVKFGAGTTYYTVQSVTWGVEGTSGTMVINALTATDAALAVDDAVITVKKPNDAFIASKQCIAFGQKPLAPYLDEKITSVTVSTPYGSCRIVYDGNVQAMTENIIVEMLVGAEVLNSDFVQKIVDLS